MHNAVPHSLHISGIFGNIKKASLFEISCFYFTLHIFLLVWLLHVYYLQSFNFVVDFSYKFKLTWIFKDMLTKINTLKQHNGLKNPSRYLKNIAVSQIVVMKSFDRNWNFQYIRPGSHKSIKKRLHSFITWKKVFFSFFAKEIEKIIFSRNEIEDLNEKFRILCDSREISFISNSYK